jgi:hypothetical protein
MFRFTIRDVLWLTALVAIIVAWGMDRYTLAVKLQMLQFEPGPQPCGRGAWPQECLGRCSAFNHPTKTDLGNANSGRCGCLHAGINT